MNSKGQVTKAEALERFVKERVLGDRGFGFNAEKGYCQNLHSNNGGCEVGQYLPAQIANSDKYMGSSFTLLRVKFPDLMHALLEDADDVWWQHLQGAHDNLALLHPYPSDRARMDPAAWHGFQQAMRYLASH